MDYLDLPMTAGSPILWHRKAGDPISEVLSEHHTNLIQPYITRTIDAAIDILAGTGMVTVGEVAKMLAMAALDELVPYPSPSRWHTVMVDYFKACREWAQLFQ
jgi:hypothetical protein